MLLIIIKKPRIAKGMPTGAPPIVMVSAIPTIINATPNIPANIRPVILSIRANKSHTAIKGHKNHGDFLFLDMDVSLFITDRNFFLNTHLF